MFDILFGWRKASKCKQLIKQVQCRIKLLKNKRATIVRQLREDAAELIKSGYEDKAFHRAEQIIKDESTVAVYELLDNFCEFILLHLSYIRRHKDCPNDINEAISSLIYASARFGDLPELRKIRKLFGERYGQKFVLAAVELFPGNLVNSQVIENLIQKSVSDDMKHRLVNGIARDYCIKPEVLAIEYYSDWQQKVKETSGHQVQDLRVRTYYEKSEMQILNVEEVGGQDFHDYKISSTASSEARLPVPTIIDSSVHNETEIEEDFVDADSPRDRQIVVYKDDIEEVLSCTTRDGEDSQDQSVFKFKAIVPKREDVKDSYDQGSLDHYEIWSENSLKSGSKISGRNSKGNGKRPRKRSVSQESQFLKDSGCLSYYARKHQKKMGTNILSCKSNGNKIVDVEAPILKQNRGVLTRVGFANLGYDHKSLYGNGAMVYNVFTYPDHQLKIQSKPFKETVQAVQLSARYGSSSSSSSSPEVTSSWTKKKMAPPYFRNATMPPERVNENRKEEFQRSISDCFQYPTHVHPKLPDYDDIAAKFMALKQERLQTKPHCSNQLQHRPTA